MFVSGRHGAVLHSFKTCRTLVPAAARQRPTGPGSNCRQPLISCLPRWSATEPHEASRRCRPSRLRRIRLQIPFGAQVLLLSGDTAIPDSCTAANDVRRIAVILLDVHFEPGQFYWCLGAY